METKFDEMPTPTLTFDMEETGSSAENELVKKEPEKTVVQEPKKEEPDDSYLTEEEKRMVEQFSSAISLEDSTQILQYGAGAQKKIADFSEKALENAKTKDLGQVGDMLSALVTELKGFEAEEEDKGFFGFFKKNTNKLALMKARYEKAEVNTEKIVDALQTHQVQLLKDIAVLDKMYGINQVYFKELSMYILAGKKKLNHAHEEELPALKAKAEASGLQEDIQKANDYASMMNRFEKKIHDLELTRMIALQMAPQIRLVQNNDTLMTEKIQSTIVNTIPLWKSQMVLALGVEHSNQAAKAQQEVTDMTNLLLKKNAETLKIATVETMKASERGIVDIETLKKTNADLISTIDEVLKIQEDGRQKRRQAEAELAGMEQQMKERLLAQ